MSRIFIVDDDPALRDALRQLLETAGLQVKDYASGDTFLAACEHERPDCVLLDMAMPGMSGHDVQASLNERDLRFPVIFLTGHGDIPMAVNAVQAGATDFLEKPVQRDVLLKRIRRALVLDEERREADRQAEEIRRRHARLSAREREVMALVVSGLSSKEIARQLGLSHRTVESHRTNIMNKMGTTSLAELITIAIHCDS
ncbi:MAG: response regulator [Gammaproteobacteria bacterium]